MVWVHNPIFRDRDEEAAAYAAVGKLAVGWGPVEMTIENLLVLMLNRQRAPTQGGAFVGFPVSYTKKRDQLKDALRDDPAVADIRAVVGPLLTEATAIHKFRIIAVHGFCQGTTAEGDLMYGVSDQKTGFAYRPHTLRMTDIRRHGDRLPVLHSELGEAHSALRDRKRL